MGFLPSGKSSKDDAVVDEKPRGGDAIEEAYTVKEEGTINEEFQSGVRKVEATMVVWNKWHLISAYIFIWFIYFITSTQEVVVRALSPFVTSSFSAHSLTTAVSVMSSIIGGISKLPLAKILDTWGRPQGLAISVFIWTMGFVMMAACKNVETYAAAQAFSTVGGQAVSYTITVFIADASALKNRGLMLAFATSPYVITTWIGGPISDSVLAGIGWRWGFGVWAIVTPIVVSPLIFLLLLNQNKAKKAGLIPAHSEPVTFASVKKFLIDIDIVGLLILMAGMSLFLMPFNLYAYQGKEWESPMIISMITIGGVLLIIFFLWERFMAPVQLVPPHLLADRTVLGGGFMIFFLFLAGILWASWFYSMLYVVWDLSVTNATYVSNIYRVGSCLTALIIGIFIRITGRFKWVSMYYGLPLYALGVGLMIYFRHSDDDIGWIIMTQIFIAFAGGPLVIAAELAMMAPIDHQHIAIILAVLDLFGSVGSAVGGSIATAMWAELFPDALEKYLPEGSPVDAIYSSIYTQLSYVTGTAERIAINQAYGEAQQYLLAAALGALGLAWVATIFWRDIKLKDIKQVIGNVV